MRIKLIIIALLLSSCSGVSRLPSFTPHKIDVRQGNLVTPEMRAKLKLGMSRMQVRAALGTPLISDALHANRWDYVYRLEQDRKLTEQQRMTVYFDGDVLTRIDDGNMPPLPVAASAVVSVLPIEPEPVPEPQPDLKPEPLTETPSISPVAVEKIVTDAVLGWAAAWAAQDVEKYLASYAPQFIPANGMSRAAWETQRRARIVGAKAIKVNLSDIKVEMQGENLASASFKQSYRAAKHADVMQKKLELEKIGDVWLIVSEQAAAK